MHPKPQPLIPVESPLNESKMDVDRLIPASSAAKSVGTPKNGRQAHDMSRSGSPESTAAHLNSQLRRPRRATSQRVDYDLKKRRIIPSDDNSKKGKRHSGDTSLQTNSNGSNSEEVADCADEEKDLIDLDESGRPAQMNEPKRITDAKNGATGLPLSQGPSDKIRKEYLWNFKKNYAGSSNNNNNAGLNSEMIIKPEWSLQGISLESEIYKSKLKTAESDSLSTVSSLREKVHADDIHAKERDKLIDSSNKKEIEPCNYRHHASHIKIKATISKESKNKLFGQNSIANLPPKNSSRLTTPVEEIENDDFCSACSQTGSFLCCDTCPRSFHFLCLNPPLNADNLPEGDWSCPQCTFKLKYNTQTLVKRVEKDFIQNTLSRNCKLFGKLIFQLEETNPRQFKLPQTIKDSFVNVKTGSRDQYTDEREKIPVSEKQLFGTPYGQSITKLDAYNPDSHFDSETGEVLLCYNCGETKMGTWDNPAQSRLIMRCDYCRTPWHLDCLPEVPRPSLKNLGTNWKCPLHAPTYDEAHKQRRLAKHQRFIEPSQTCGFKNNGEIDIDLDQISAPGSKLMVESVKHFGDFPPISVMKESSVKLDFLDKIYRAKKAQRNNELKCQEHLIDKLIVSSLSTPKDSKNIELKNLVSFIYFTLNKNQNVKKFWDFKELCKVAECELEKEKISSEEINQLVILKKLLESKPKEELMKFLNLESF